MKVHPAADLFPMLPDDELQALADDIKQNGLVHPIVQDAKGQLIVDGRNRLAACKLAGVEPRFEQLNDEQDPLAYIFSTNLNRRDLSKGQKAMIVAQAQRLQSNHSQRQSATIAGLSQSRIAQAATVLQYAPEMADGVAAGSMALNDACEEARRRKGAVSAKDVQMDRLRSEASDLADLLKQEKLRLSDGIAALEQRFVEERNARRSTTRAVTGVLTALETGERSPREAANDWIRNIDFSLELTKGQQAMALAMLYPEPEKGGKGKNVAARKAQQSCGFSGERLRQARSILAFSRLMAEAVLKGVDSLNEALGKMKALTSQATGKEAQSEMLRTDAPDPAELVEQERMALSKAIAALNERLMRLRGNYQGGVSAAERLMTEFCCTVATILAGEEARQALTIADPIRVKPEVLKRVEAAVSLLKSASFAAGHGCDGETNWSSAVRPGRAISSMFPSVPPQEINLRSDEPCEAVVVRSGQDPIVVNLEIESPEPSSAESGAPPFHPDA
jgi:uncharacterized RmlC-like cupin family protein